MAGTTKIKLSEIFGGGYKEFLESRKFFRVVKGGRASKKSSTAFTEAPKRIMQYPMSNIVVVRQTANTHETSTFAEIQKGIDRLKCKHLWKINHNPCEMTYKPTGQKILFRGFDDPYKLTSLQVPVGVVCWVYIEEAYEILDEESFWTLCEGIRGRQIEEYGLWPQVTLIYNPWTNGHWTKKVFWDVEREDTFRLTTTHKCNEFLTEDDHARVQAGRTRYKSV
jgi:phage terminase large subunit